MQERHAYEFWASEHVLQRLKQLSQILFSLINVPTGQEETH